MTAGEINPLIHVPARLRIMATLSVLPVGDTLSFTRLQHLIGLSSGNLITHLRKLEEAEYIQTEKSGIGATSRTDVVLTPKGRQALNVYKAALHDLIDEP